MAELDADLARHQLLQGRTQVGGDKARIALRREVAARRGGFGHDRIGDPAPEGSRVNLTDDDVMLKYVLREGVLQDRTGISVAGPYSGSAHV